MSDLNLGNLFLSGYKTALRAHGIRFRAATAIRTESSEQGGYELGEKLLSIAPRPTAVLLSYELPAGGLYRRLKEAGVLPGRDIAVIGFRESPQTRHLVPSLTSFTTSLRDLGAALADMLLSRMPAYASRYPDWPTSTVWPMVLLPGDSDSFVVSQRRRS
jgi:DNA-binding LacI/PurR family transcriptional regulator